RRAGLHCQVHDLADLLGVRLGERAAEDGEVLRKDVDDATADPAKSGDDAVAHDPLVVRNELRRSRQHERVELRERSLVEHEINAFPGSELPLRVLLRDPLLSATKRSLGAHFGKSVLYLHRPLRVGHGAALDVTAILPPCVRSCSRSGGSRSIRTASSWSLVSSSDSRCCYGRPGVAVGPEATRR